MNPYPPFPGRLAFRFTHILCCLLLLGCHGERPPNPMGVVIQSIPPQYADKTNLQVGDVWRHWEAPGTGGLFQDPLDMIRVAECHAPGGQVRVGLLRDGRELRVGTPPSWREITVRPYFTGRSARLEAHLLHAYQRGDEGNAARRLHDLDLALAAPKWRPTRAFLWMEQAVFLARQKAPVQARAALDRALELGDTANHGYILLKAGAAFSQAGFHEDAVTQLQRAHDLFNSAPLHRAAQASALSELGKAYLRMEDAQTAETYFLAALSLVRDQFGESLPAASILTNLVLTARRRDDLDTAIRHGEDAIKIKRRLDPNGLSTIRGCLNLGLAYTDRGALLRAGKLLSEGINLHRRVYPNQDCPDRQLLGRLLVARGNVANHRWDLETAKADYLAALDLAESSNDVAGKASIYNNLGTIAEQQGDESAARDWYTKSLDQQNANNGHGLEKARCLGNLGYLAYSTGNLKGAAEFCERAMDFLIGDQDQATVRISILQNQGRVYTATGDLDAAHLALQEALCLARHISPDSYDTAVTLHLFARLAMAERDTHRAEQLLEEAIQALENQIARLGGEPIARGNFISKYRIFYEDLTQLLVDRGDHRAAFRVQERSRAPILRGIPAKAVNQGPFRITGNDQAGEVDPLYPAMDVQQVQATLEPDTLLLAYTVLRHRTLLFAISGGKGDAFAMEEIDIGKVGLANNVTAFLRELAKEKTDDAEIHKRGARLFELLLQPLADQIADAQRVVIVADDPLYQLPFAALSPDGDRYLIQWKPLSMAASATVLAGLKALPPVTHQKAALFGDPVYSGTEWAALPNSRAEVAAVADALTGPMDEFIGPDALAERVLALDTSYSHLHFALHCRLNRELPLHSALVFSTPSDSDDNLLELGTVLDQMKLNADLVVLSACETALGLDLGGEGPASPAFAFQCVGARSVAASLWRVDDAATAQLMASFYRALATGATKTNALQAAQIHMITGPEAYRRPQHWAAFVLFGLWQ